MKNQETLKSLKTASIVQATISAENTWKKLGSLKPSRSRWQRSKTLRWVWSYTEWAFMFSHTCAFLETRKMNKNWGRTFMKIWNLWSRPLLATIPAEKTSQYCGLREHSFFHLYENKCLTWVWFIINSLLIGRHVSNIYWWCLNITLIIE